MDTLITGLPPEIVGFVLTLALGLLIGLEREEHEPRGLGGVRTFPLMGLAGFLLVWAFPGSPLPFAIGMIVLGGLIALSHWDSIRQGEPGITTEMAALLTYALGAGAAIQLYWLTIAGGVVTVILLQEKTRLEALATRLPADELRTLVRFLVLSGVILPAVPDHALTRFEINPFKVWLVVVAVSGVSYASYLLQRRWDGGRGLLLSGLLGGAYSSTVTTVVLARRSQQRQLPARCYAGGIVAATGVMYIRLWILVALFAPPLAARLTLLFWGFGAAAIAVGAALASRTDRRAADQPTVDMTDRSGNPLEISSAVTFAGLFTVVLVATRFVAERFGGAGVLVLAAAMGAADVDPFILGLTQYAGGGLDYGAAALAIVVAAATNNLAKGIYAAVFGSRPAGRISLGLLAVLGAASIVLFLI